LQFVQTSEDDVKQINARDQREVIEVPRRDISLTRQRDERHEDLMRNDHDEQYGKHERCGVRSHAQVKQRIIDSGKAPDDHGNHHSDAKESQQARKELYVAAHHAEIKAHARKQDKHGNGWIIVEETKHADHLKPQADNEYNKERHA